MQNRTKQNPIKRIQVKETKSTLRTTNKASQIKKEIESYELPKSYCTESSCDCENCKITETYQNSCDNQRESH